MWALNLLFFVATAQCANVLYSPSPASGLKVSKGGSILKARSAPALGTMRLRGGNEDSWRILRELMRGRQGHGEPSIVDTVLDSMQALPPTTRTLLVANVAVYLLARLGLLGSNPAERFGFKARDILADPARNAHKMLTGTFLHLTPSHIASNMMVLSSVGSKLESRLGSRKMAVIVFFLVPIIGATQLTITLLLNAVAASVGVCDLERNETRGDSAEERTRSAEGALTRIVRHQVSVNTISIGFSGVLFALDALATRILSGKASISIRLDEMPHQVRFIVMQYLSRYIDRRWGSPQLAVPIEWAPFAQVLISQLSDPDHVSFVGHLAGAVGAMVLQTGQGLEWWHRVFPAYFRYRRGLSQPPHSPLLLKQVLIVLLGLLPMHLAVWFLGRRAVLLASAKHQSCATDWQGALKSLISSCFPASAASAQHKGKGKGWGWAAWSTHAKRTWGAGTWGGDGRSNSGFVGERVGVVGLQRQPELNGLEGTILGVEKKTGRFIVRLQGFGISHILFVVCSFFLVVRCLLLLAVCSCCWLIDSMHTCELFLVVALSLHFFYCFLSLHAGVEEHVSVRPQNIVRLLRSGFPQPIDPRAWTVSQVCSCARMCVFACAPVHVYICT